MTEFTERQLKELEHNRKILKSADKIWGRESLIGKMRIQRRAEMFCNAAGLNEKKNVLEIGCGTGELTQFLVGSKAKVTATDIFEDFLKAARKRISSPNIKFECAKGETLDSFSSNSFDTICGVSVLHHLDIRKALRNIYRVLKPKGKIVFSEPNMLNPQIALQKNIPFIKKLMGDSENETAFFRFQIKSLLKEAGFVNISVKPFDFAHPALPDFTLPLVKGIGYVLENIPLVKELAGSLFIVAEK